MRDDVHACFVGIEVSWVQSMLGVPLNVWLTKGATSPIRDSEGGPCNSSDLHKAETALDRLTPRGAWKRRGPSPLDAPATSGCFAAETSGGRPTFNRRDTFCRGLIVS